MENDTNVKLETQSQTSAIHVMKRDEVCQLLRNRKKEWLRNPAISPKIKQIIEQQFSDTNLEGNRLLPKNTYYVNVEEQPVLSYTITDNNGEQQQQEVFNLGTLEYLITHSNSDNQDLATVVLDALVNGVESQLTDTSKRVYNIFHASYNLLQRTQNNEVQPVGDCVQSIISMMDTVREHSSKTIKHVITHLYMAITHLIQVIDESQSREQQTAIIQLHQDLVNFELVLGQLAKQSRTQMVPSLVTSLTTTTTDDNSNQLSRLFSNLTEQLFQPDCGDLKQMLDVALKNTKDHISTAFSIINTLYKLIERCSGNFEDTKQCQNLHTTMREFTADLFELSRVQQQTIKEKLGQIIGQIDDMAQINGYPPLQPEMGIIKQLVTSLVHDGNPADGANGVYLVVLQALDKIRSTNRMTRITDLDLNELPSLISKALSMPLDQFTKNFGNNPTLKLDLLRVQCAINMVLHPDQVQQCMQQFVSQMQQQQQQQQLAGSRRRLPEAAQRDYAILDSNDGTRERTCIRTPAQIICLNQGELNRITDNPQLTSENNDRMSVYPDIDLIKEYDRLVTCPLIEKQIAAVNQIILSNRAVPITVIVRNKELFSTVWSDGNWTLSTNSNTEQPTVTPVQLISYEEIAQNPQRWQQFNLDNNDCYKCHRDYKHYIVLDAPRTYQEKQALNIFDSVIDPIFRVDDPIVAEKCYQQQLNPQATGLVQLQNIQLTDDDGRIISRELFAKCATLEDLILAKPAAESETLAITTQALMEFIMFSGLLDDPLNPKYLHTVRVISNFPRTGQALLDRFIQQHNNGDAQILNALLLSTEPNIQKQLRANISPNRSSKCFWKYYPKGNPNSLFGSLNDEEMRNQFASQKKHLAHVLASLPLDSTGSTDRMSVISRMVNAINNDGTSDVIKWLLNNEQLSSMQKTQLCIAVNNLNAIVTTPSFSSNPFRALFQHWRWFGFKKELAVSKNEIIEALYEMGRQQSRQQEALEMQPVNDQLHR